MTGEEQRPTPKNWWLVTLALVGLTMVGMHLICLQETESAVAKAKQVYSIEGKILLGRFQERIEFNSRASWDLNEWTPRANYYREQYYNLLLEYNEPSLTALVLELEACLMDLVEFKQAGDSDSVEIQIDKCNEVGKFIDAVLLGVLEEKVGGVE